MTRRAIARSMTALVVLAPWLLVTATMAAGGESQGALVHVADTRHLTGFNLYFANLYNADRLLFTTMTVGLTGLLGLSLGVLMDIIVGTIGLDLGKREAKE
ncbi:MAG: hypothetical protein NTV05_02715 [Acidobacteria bacterium]|nr:hypothetical protein [Acidobacteriota bacterium]